MPDSCTMSSLPVHDSHWFITLVVLALIVVPYFLRRHLQNIITNPRCLPLPPGPMSFPIIGNIFDFPSKKPWLAYASMSKDYGDVIHLNILGQPIIVLGSMKAITDLLEKRSAKYSDRPYSTMLCDLMGGGWGLPVMRYGNVWRAHRRAFQEHFSPVAIEKYQHIHSQAVHHLLKRLAETPEDFVSHIEHTFAVINMMTTYGIDVSETNQEFVTVAKEAMEGFVAAGIPGDFLVDFIPALKYIPAWIPGASFKRKAQRWRLCFSMMLENPWEHARNSLQKNNANDCIAASILESLPEGELGLAKEIIGRNMLCAAYAGATDTTTSTIQLFFLAMAMYPEVQKKAQAELDIIVGPHRLPTHGDRCSLPYIQALINELLRWQPVAPLAALHCTSNHDEYQGFFIPQGSVVIANAWAVLHDPVEYPDPEIFKPERYLKDGELDPSVRDPRMACFGFGRRICPGRHFGDDSIFAIITSVLHVYNVGPALDVQERPIPMDLNMTSGIISYPEAFRCSITPRTDLANVAFIQNVNLKRRTCQ